MSIALRLKVMSFLQYFIWGSWLVTLGSYMINTLHFTGANVGMVYSSKGIAAIIMPGIMGIIADKWLRAERAYMLCHLVCAGVLFYAASVTDPDMMFWVMLVMRWRLCRLLRYRTASLIPVLPRQGLTR